MQTQQGPAALLRLRPKAPECVPTHWRFGLGPSVLGRGNPRCFRPAAAASHTAEGCDHPPAMGKVRRNAPGRLNAIVPAGAPGPRRPHHSACRDASPLTQRDGPRWLGRCAGPHGLPSQPRMPPPSAGYGGSGGGRQRGAGRCPEAAAACATTSASGATSTPQGGCACAIRRPRQGKQRLRRAVRCPVPSQSMRGKQLCSCCAAAAREEMRACCGAGPEARAMQAGGF